jgi:hypothetical protein
MLNLIIFGGILAVSDWTYWKSQHEQLCVEGWRNSWLSRISELLVGKD